LHRAIIAVAPMTFSETLPRFRHSQDLLRILEFVSFR
jgi:hypothetical protein